MNEKNIKARFLEVKTRETVEMQSNMSLNMNKFYI